MINALNNVGIFLIEVLCTIFLYAVLLRFFLQWVKADFYNPLSQLVMRITNPLLKPLRRLIPGFFGLDIASVVLAYIVALIQLILIAILISGFLNISWQSIVFIAVIKLFLTAINLYIWLIILRAITSWFTQGTYNPVITALYQLTEPLLQKVRKILPPTKSGFDFSPIVIVVIFICIQIFISSVIPL